MGFYLDKWESQQELIFEDDGLVKEFDIDDNDTSDVIDFILDLYNYRTEYLFNDYLRRSKSGKDGDMEIDLSDKNFFI